MPKKGEQMPNLSNWSGWHTIAVALVGLGGAEKALEGNAFFGPYMTAAEGITAALLLVVTVVSGSAVVKT